MKGSPKRGDSIMHETLLGRRERENTEANSLEEMFERLEMSK